jgi:hypothetical protein
MKDNRQSTAIEDTDEWVAGRDWAKENLIPAAVEKAREEAREDCPKQMLRRLDYLRAGYSPHDRTYLGISLAMDEIATERPNYPTEK